LGGLLVTGLKEEARIAGQCLFLRVHAYPRCAIDDRDLRLNGVRLRVRVFLPVAYNISIDSIAKLIRKC
jgi:hypothetical protein